MSEPLHDIARLLHRRLKGELNETEQQQLDEWLASSPHTADLLARLAAEGALDQRLSQIAAVDTAVAQERVTRLLFDSHPVATVRRMHFSKSAWFRYAAAAVLLFGVAAYFTATYRKPSKPAVVAMHATDIPPGRSGAILTLANGTQVVLDSLNNGVIASQNGTQVILKNGGLTYTPHDAASGEVVYNTITTPRGRQFQVVLPDGTGVWLNAGSSIRYPAAFVGNNRTIQVKGEVYLEVARNEKMPFFLEAGDKATIAVLGTRFNINAYEDENAIATTLLAGAIRLQQHGGEAVVLKPGQQARIQPGQHHIQVEEADTEKVIAWKNGAFNFDGANLEEVMRQLERWYDIDVQYKGHTSNRIFRGKMDRNLHLAEVLDAFKQMGIKYELNDHVLIIY